ncbi:MAG: DedD protein [Candidatus Azotimanducaceae bacterium]
MDTRLKQRVIGAVVMTTVAIIILPMLLDGSSEDRARVESAIPQPPQIDINSLTVEETSQKMLEMADVSKAKLPVMKEDTVVLPQDSENFSLNQNGLPISWSLQLGSFRQEANATRLRQTLREKDYRSYILSGDGDDELFRVYVGPMVNKDKLLKAQGEIESELKFSGQVVRYRIEDDRYQLGG